MISREEIEEEVSYYKSEDFPIRRTVFLDYKDLFIMDLLEKNAMMLLKYTDYEKGDKHRMLKTLMTHPTGFINLDKDNKNQYYIRGILLYEHDMLPGHNNIILLYGESDILKRSMIVRSMEYLEENEIIEDPKYRRTLNAYVYNSSQDEDIYIDLKFRFKDAHHNLETEELIYVLYTYKYPI